MQRLQTNTSRRSEARTYRPADQIRNHRVELAHCPATIRRTLQIRFWRSLSSRFGSADLEIHLRSSCSRIPLPGQGQREGILAGQAASGMLHLESRQNTADYGPPLSSCNRSQTEISPPPKTDSKRRNAESFP